MWRGRRTAACALWKSASIEGDWQPAQLGASYSNDTWRLWSFGWQADEPGPHTIAVRATDNTGAVQTAEQADPVPDGATGLHTVSFAVK